MFSFFIFSGSVSNFALFIAEDDGSPDSDFPSLDPKEIVGKFGFTSLALVRTCIPEKEVNKEEEISDEVSHSTKTEDQLGPVTVLESTDYHSFRGFLLHKVRPKTEINLGKQLIFIINCCHDFTTIDIVENMSKQE